MTPVIVNANKKNYLINKFKNEKEYERDEEKDNDRQRQVRSIGLWWWFLYCLGDDEDKWGHEESTNGQSVGPQHLPWESLV